MMQGNIGSDAGAAETKKCEICGAETQIARECQKCGSSHYTCDGIDKLSAKYCSGCFKPMNEAFPCREEGKYAKRYIPLGPCMNCGSEYLTHILPPTRRQKIVDGFFTHILPPTRRQRIVDGFSNRFGIHFIRFGKHLIQLKKSRILEKVKLAAVLLLLFFGLIILIDSEVIDYNKASANFPVVVTANSNETTSLLVVGNSLGFWHQQGETAAVLTLADGSKILGLVREGLKDRYTPSRYGADYKSILWYHLEFIKFDKDWNFVAHVPFDDSGFFTVEQANRYLLESGRNSYYADNPFDEYHVFFDFVTGNEQGSGGVNFLDVDWSLVGQYFANESYDYYFILYMYYYYDYETGVIRLRHVHDPDMPIPKWVDANIVTSGDAYVLLERTINDEHSHSLRLAINKGNDVIYEKVSVLSRREGSLTYRRSFLYGGPDGFLLQLPYDEARDVYEFFILSEDGQELRLGTSKFPYREGDIVGWGMEGQNVVLYRKSYDYYSEREVLTNLMWHDSGGWTEIERNESFLDYSYSLQGIRYAVDHDSPAIIAYKKRYVPLLERLLFPDYPYLMLQLDGVLLEIYR